MKKRGLSNIISTVLIVLLVIVIVGVVWITISKLITTSSQNVEKSQQEILLSQNKFSIIQDSVVVNEDKSLQFSLKRLTGEKTITGINIVLKDSAGNIRTIYKNISFEIGESKLITLSSSEINLNDVVKIEIYPTINSGSIVSSSSTGKFVPSSPLNTTTNSTLPSNCNNGNLDAIEMCDINITSWFRTVGGGNMTGTSCSVYNNSFASGNVSCSSNCLNINTNECSLPLPNPCNNGILDAGETCDIGGGTERYLNNAGQPMVDGEKRCVIYNSTIYQYGNLSCANCVTNTSSCAYNPWALKFNLVGDYVSIPKSNILSNNFSEMTISMWIYRTSAVNRSILFYNYLGGGRYAKIGVMNSANYIWFDTVINGIQYYNDITIPNGEITTNTWTILTFVYNGSRWNYYRNAEFRNASKVEHSGSITTSQFTSWDWWFGKDDYQGFNGTMDDIRVYNRALTQNEITQLLIEGQGANIPTGLVGWWKFDQGSGTMAADSSGNSNHGTLIGEPVWVRRN